MLLLPTLPRANERPVRGVASGMSCATCSSVIAGPQCLNDNACGSTVTCSTGTGAELRLDAAAQWQMWRGILWQDYAYSNIAGRSLSNAPRSKCMEKSRNHCTGTAHRNMSMVRIRVTWRFVSVASCDRDGCSATCASHIKMLSVCKVLHCRLRQDCSA